ncbi:EamA family transporter [Bordetella genomosp. 9]|uniref:EamA family transporter n=1 Tax=Bordetella genomosp. 9 TaxID=1416803 RepID=A0A261RMX3_9BORD|nr:EamA family transporter [Bordetella genomosp. 9]OZI26379.1 EamA family transporter [Bordetella genomosp. 9]
MLGYTGGIVLLAALMHASWNAMLHGNSDRLLSMAWMSIAIAAVSTVAVACLPLPDPAAWPYIAASGLTHVIYNASLVHSYRRGDLTQAYPIARGSSPLLVTLGAAIFAHEEMGPLRLLGIALVSGGIIALALHRRPSAGKGTRLGLLAAFGTGALIAIYTVIDGMGVRLSNGQAMPYIAWMFLFYWLTPLLFIASRGVRALWAPARGAPAAVWTSIAGGLVSIGAYGIVIWAMQWGEMGAVSALRETSVVFALLIGRTFLGETVSVQRWVACSVVAAGAICLGA